MWKIPASPTSSGPLADGDAEGRACRDENVTDHVNDLDLTQPFRLTCDSGVTYIADTWCWRPKRRRVTLICPPSKFNGYGVRPRHLRRLYKNKEVLVIGGNTAVEEALFLTLRRQGDGRAPARCVPAPRRFSRIACSSIPSRRDLGLNSTA
jgi:hypothetical protein